MLKKTIKFKDLDGNDVVEDFYFNLSKPEIVELEVKYDDGLEGQVKRFTRADGSPHGKIIMETFKDLIAGSVGKRSEDGRRFIKNQDIIDEFMQSDAYSEFFMELVTDAEAAQRFLQGVLPSDVAERVAQHQAAQDLALPGEKTDEPAWISEGREPNEKELREATPEQLRIAFARKNDRA